MVRGSRTLVDGLAEVIETDIIPIKVKFLVETINMSIAKYISAVLLLFFASNSYAEITK